MNPQRSILRAKRLDDPVLKRKDALDQIVKLKEAVACIAATAAPEDFLQGAAQICQMRAAIYENLNQFPHEVLVLEAQRRLAEMPGFTNLDWFWHPRQTSGVHEADLMGWRGDTLVVCAEASTVSKPQGTSKKRLHKALENLMAVEHPASRYLFCTFQSSAQEARRVIAAKPDYAGIKVIAIEEETISK
jgi:hypothetical protein